MSTDDRERWDRRHRQAGPPDTPRPPGAFAPYLDQVPTEGSALELACGRGETTVWLARRGLNCLGVDVSEVAIEMAKDLAAREGVTERCRFEVHDLEHGLPEGAPVGLLVCHLFYDPSLTEAIVERLGPGGMLLLASLSEVGAGPGPYRAGPGELAAAFSHLEPIVHTEEDGIATYIGRKPLPV